MGRRGARGTCGGVVGVRNVRMVCEDVWEGWKMCVCVCDGVIWMVIDEMVFVTR